MQIFIFAKDLKIQILKEYLYIIINAQIHKQIQYTNGSSKWQNLNGF